MTIFVLDLAVTQHRFGHSEFPLNSSVLSSFDLFVKLFIIVKFYNNNITLCVPQGLVQLLLFFRPFRSTQMTLQCHGSCCCSKLC